MLPETPSQITTFTVDPERLAWGQWCHRLNKEVGEGDIAASYSGDRIGMEQPVRRPFSWQGKEWVCTSMHHRAGAMIAEAYPLVALQQFTGDALHYGERKQDGDAARADPLGFYNGMKVKCAGRILVLCGPPAEFEAGEPAQKSLFDF
jgi:hypothetical protein